MDDLISNLTRCGANEEMRIGDAIRRERKKAGLTQGELADRLDVTQSLIGQYERGVRNPKPSTVRRIADALGVPFTALAPVSSAQPETHDKRTETHGVCLDAISRQTVLDAIDEISREVDDGDGFDYAKWREYFCELPPIQFATDTNVGTKLGTNLAQLGTDCISRQAAIDALDVLCQEHRYKIPGKGETYSQYNEAWQDALDRAEGAIFNLPSAEPKIIYCKDCRKHNKKVGFDEKFHTVWKEDACPLASWRGKAQGHEFDYQFCAFGERRTE